MVHTAKVAKTGGNKLLNISGVYMRNETVTEKEIKQIKKRLHKLCPLVIDAFSDVMQEAKYYSTPYEKEREALSIDEILKKMKKKLKKTKV